MSVICQNFVQNAWRKDLCSNCFKCEADHSECGFRNTSDRILSAGRYIPQATALYQSRTLSTNIHWRPLLPEPVTRIQDRIACRDFGSQTILAETVNDETKSILKGDTKLKNRRRSSVGFAPEEPLVIGYGGRDYDSDDSPWELGSDDGSINLELLDLTDEDRSITKLTKKYTEFNSVNENLKSTNIPLTSQTESKNNVANSPREISKKPESKQDNYYYFSAKDETIKTYLPTLNDQTNYLNSCKEMSIIQKDIPGILNNIQNNCKYDRTEKLDNINEIHLVNEHNLGLDAKKNSECQLKNSLKYLLITKIQDSGGSDSDYSTSKQTNGESSTDSESFHDAEDTFITPCSSFLHGTIPAESKVNGRTYIAKPFETSSVSSADASTLSDDSDSIKSQEEGITKRTFNGTKNVSCTINNDKKELISTQQKQDFRIDEISSHLHKKNVDSNKNQIEDKTKHSPDETCLRYQKTTEPEKNKSVITTDLNPKPPLKKHTVVDSQKIKCDTYASKIVLTNSQSPSTENIKHKDTKRIESDNQSTTNIQKKSEAVLSNVKTDIYNTTIIVNTISSKTETPKVTTVQTQPRKLFNKNEECKKWIEESEEWRNLQIKSKPTTTEFDDQADSQHNQDQYSNESSSSSTRSSPNARDKRESKLAALALELEQVRCDSEISKEMPKRIMPEVPPPYPSTRTKPTAKVESVRNTSTAVDPTCKYPSIRRGRSLISANQSPKSSLPDLLPEPTVKVKRGRFSLKKLLKRGKDSDTLVINNVGDYNPKAWKKQNFNRDRLSLEIVHPMDLTQDPGTSSDSTPTEEKRNSISVFSDPYGKRLGNYTASAQRARSLSALPQLGSCVSEISDLKDTGLAKDDNSSLDRTPAQMDMPRKAGTVAERSKKYKAPRRTPSFSELTTSTNSGRSTACGAPTERPPKPPPPPRGKSLPPAAPPPPPQEKSPRRPPPPKAPESNESNSVSTRISNKSNDHIGDYANLGDIRLNITPKKPQRPSAVSFARDISIDDGPQQACPNHGDNTYESLETHEEEDHYSYVDETEKTNEIETPRSQKKADIDKQLQPNGTQSAIPRTSIIMKKPWMNLHASYAAIAAANYESLAELITTAISEGLEQFQKTASSMRWSDFDLESDDPIQVLEDKIVYNAVYKSETKTKVTLMVTTQKQHTAQNCRNSNRLPVLATFSDFLPKQYMNVGIKHPNYSESGKAMIYVLQRSKTTTVNQFAQDSACFQTNQHVHLRNACFVLLQLIHTLKGLQAEGIEEIDYDLGRILLLHTDVDKPPILVLLPGDKVYLTKTDFYKADVAMRKTTLCQTILRLLFHLLQIKTPTDLKTCVVNGECLAEPVAYTFEVIAKVLSEEKASSMTQAKGLLEYMLWGPVDIKTSGNDEDIDVILQRWLDLQRAQMVKSLVSNLHLKISSHTGFHVYEEYQLIFLLQATVKSLKDIIVRL